VSILNIEKALKPNQHYRSDTARKPSKVAKPLLGSPQMVLRSRQRQRLGRRFLTNFTFSVAVRHRLLLDRESHQRYPPMFRSLKGFDCDLQVRLFVDLQNSNIQRLLTEVRPNR
jgi:hypothetical protein